MNDQYVLVRFILGQNGQLFSTPERDTHVRLSPLMENRPRLLYFL